MRCRVSFISCIKRYLKGFRNVNVSVRNVVLSPSQLLSGKVALITGASRGIGFAIAQQYINAGAKVIGVAKTEAGLILTKQQLGDHFQYIIADFSQYDQLSSVVAKALDVHGRIDIMVNAAGIKNGQEERYWDFESNDFDYAIAVNVKAPFFLSRDVIKYFLDNKIHGHIINIIGIKGLIGEGSPYSISKFGLSGMTKGLARRFAPNGIVINGSSPGATMAGHNILSKDKNMLNFGSPNMRMAEPQEIANIALFLASGMADNMVGTIVVSDGGQILQYQNNRY